MKRRSNNAMSDLDLYGELASGGTRARNALDEFYRRYASPVFRYCLRVTGERELAEDLVHETFINFFRSASPDRMMTNVEAFIIRIARNLCLNARKRKGRDTVPLDNLDLAYDDLTCERTELEQIVVMALQGLSEDYREALVLCEYGGRSYAEIAEILGITLATVRIRIFRARRSLRTILEPYMRENAERPH